MSSQRRLEVLRRHLTPSCDKNADHIELNSTSMASVALKIWRDKPAPETLSRAGKAIVVTGAAGGLGVDLCNELLKSNCIVYACDLRRESLEKSFASSLQNPNLKLFEMDVSSPESVTAGAEFVKNDLNGGKLFAIVNNAGIGVAKRDCEVMGLVEHTEEDMKIMFEVNVFGTMRTTNAFYPLLTKSTTDKDKSGVVVNVASVAGLLGIPYGSYYSATKFSVVGYSDSLRRELQSVGVRVACLEPGFAKTNILHMPQFSKTSEFAKFGLRRQKIMKKWTDDAQEVSNVTNAFCLALFQVPTPEHQLVDQFKYASTNKLLFQYMPYYISDKMMA